MKRLGKAADHCKTCFNDDLNPERHCGWLMAATTSKQMSTQMHAKTGLEVLLALHNVTRGSLPEILFKSH